jgi:hypothetical protein
MFALGAIEGDDDQTYAEDVYVAAAKFLDEIAAGDEYRRQHEKAGARPNLHPRGHHPEQIEIRRNLQAREEKRRRLKRQQAEWREQECDDRRIDELTERIDLERPFVKRVRIEIVVAVEDLDRSAVIDGKVDRVSRAVPRQREQQRSERGERDRPCRAARPDPPQYLHPR